MVYFGLAYIHLEAKHNKSGLDFARKALHLIETSRVFQLFLDQGNRSRVVSEALIKAGEKSPFLDKVLENLPEKQNVQITIPNSHSIMVHSLGVFRVLVNGEEISQERWVSAKARDLLAYFITQRAERVPAERAFDAIWGEKGGTSRTAFHTALTRLRNALRIDKKGPRLILVEVGEYWLDSARFKIDVDEFDSALAQARASTNAGTAADWYERAVMMVQGEYLQNMYYEWVFPERRRLMQSHLAALQELAAYHLASQSPKEAFKYIEKAISLDQLNEDLYALSMRVCAALGDRAGVKRIYADLQRLLRAELDADPMPETDRLYLSLLGK